MRKPTVAALLLVALVVVPDRVQSQGLGGLIKKKAIEAVKGKEPKKDEGQTVAKDNGPITSQFEKECGPLTADAVDRFLKGMEAELAQRVEFDRKRSAAKPDEEVRACEQKEAMGPEALKLMQRGMTEGTPVAQLQKAMEQNRTDLGAYILKKCGEPVSKYGQFDSNAAAQAGAKAAGMSDECYGQFKEVALFFCKGLTAEQQKTATDQGIRVPGKGNGVWVYTADEAKALAPRCGQLVRQIGATGYTLM
jgi:hypothetical protein